MTTAQQAKHALGIAHSIQKEVDQTLQPKKNDLLTVSEVAKMLRVDDTTVRRWVKRGALEAVVLPHLNARQAYRIKRETMDGILGDQGHGIN